MNKKLFAASLSIILLALPITSLAISFLPQPTGNEDFSQRVETIINNIFKFLIWPIVLTVVIVLFIMAGITFLTAAGDPGKLDTARKFVIWGVVGVIVILLSFSIVKTVQTLLEPPPIEMPIAP